MIDLMVTEATIVTMDPKRRVVENGMLAVDEGRIVAIGRELDYQARKTISAKGGVVLPGLVNGHTHVY
ncbi:MAG: hypothetical protein M1482_08715, partial [Chloroflexi bacterium]|nr:hypothetical protein [Chloroflexota bacterium]